GMQHDREHELDRGEYQPEKHERGGWRRPGDVEGVEQRWLAEEEAEQQEHRAEVQDAERHAARDGPTLPVSDLVRHHGHPRARVERAEQRVEQRDPAVPSEAGEEGVALRRAARSVDDVHVGERKADRTPVVENGVTQAAGGERREATEERHDPRRRDELDHDDSDGAESPSPGPGPRAGLLEEPEDGRQERSPEHESDEQSVHPVGYERGDGGPVEPEALLDHEGRPRREGKPHQDAREPERADEGEAGHDGSEAEGPRAPVDPAEAAAEPEEEEDQQLYAGRDGGEARPRAHVGL